MACLKRETSKYILACIKAPTACVCTARQVLLWILKRRGTGVRTRLELNSDGITPIPKRDWQSYLKNVDSKREFFSCISKRLARDGADKQIVKYWYENIRDLQPHRGWHTYMYISAPGPCSISGSRKSFCTNSWQCYCCSSSEFVWKRDACRIMDWIS